MDTLLTYHRTWETGVGFGHEGRQIQPFIICFSNRPVPHGVTFSSLFAVRRFSVHEFFCDDLIETSRQNGQSGQRAAGNYGSMAKAGLPALSDQQGTSELRLAALPKSATKVGCGFRCPGLDFDFPQKEKLRFTGVSGIKLKSKHESHLQKDETLYEEIAVAFLIRIHVRKPGAGRIGCGPG